MILKILIFLILLFTPFLGYAKEAESCQWDGYKKVVWIDDFEQISTGMAYPAPSDLFIRRLTPMMDQGDRLIVDHRLNHLDWPDIHKAKLDAQIIVTAKLLVSNFSSETSLFGAEYGGKTTVNLQIYIFDNFSKTNIRSINFEGSKRLFPIIFSNSQINQHDQMMDIIGDLLPNIARTLSSELNCIPYATRVSVINANELIISGGIRNNIQPRMSFSILADSDKGLGSIHSQHETIIFKKLSEAVIYSVSPSISFAKSPVNIGQFYKTLIATPTP